MAPISSLLIKGALLFTSIGSAFTLSGRRRDVEPIQMHKPTDKKWNGRHPMHPGYRH